MPRRFRILLEMPVLATLVTAAFTIALHGFCIVETPSTPTRRLVVELADQTPEELARVTILGYCGSCHQNGRSGIDFTENLLRVEEMRRDRSAWAEVARRVRSREMPPRRFPQPSDAQRAAIVSWIENEVLQAPAETRPQILARRLQRTEYTNTIRDLLGVQFDPPADFPKDEIAFRLHSGERGIPLEVLAKYQAAARSILERAFNERPHGSNLLASLHTARCADHVEMAQARHVLTDFARRAYRGKIDADEIDRLAAILDQAELDGKSVDESVKAALMDVLTSRRFLIRSEGQDGASTSSSSDSLALASRLSFFLWRTTPDEELLAQAEQGTLVRNLESQVNRMLKDPRARAFAVDFTTSWLTLGKLDGVRDEEGLLRDAMRQETEEFMAHLLRDDRSVVEILDADYTFVNERLARHYGIPGIHGDKMRRVDLAGTGRAGILAHASVLRATAMEDDTSPVVRGKWVLETLLGAPPIRPPAGILQALESAPNDLGAGTVRQLLEVHRANPSCAKCHWRMDALGLALEHFDSHGLWRTTSDKGVVDAVGLLPDGETLNGFPDLKAYLVRHREEFVRSLGQGLLQFALGRKLNDIERLALERLPDQVAGRENRFSSVILQVVQSEPFRNGHSER